MKKILFLGLILATVIGCKKDNSASDSKQSVSDNLLLSKTVYDRKDTTTERTNKTTLIVNSTISTQLAVVYNGNGNYSFTASVTGAQNALLTYTLYKNGAVYQAGGSLQSPTLTLSGIFGPGTYYFTIGTANAGTLVTPSFVVVAEPVAPSGMLCLYRYYNSVNHQHVCTYDWEELGSGEQGWAFEQVLAYTYPSISSAPNLKPIYRYYEPADGSHFTTDIFTTPPGFVYEKILGYVGTSQTATLTKPLTKWYNSSIDDHFVCISPVVPIAPGYTKDIDFIIGYGQ